MTQGRIIFRANESAAAGRDRVIRFYTRNLKTQGEREAAGSFIDHLIAMYGPVVDGYPTWHPFVRVAPIQAELGYHPHQSPQGFVDLDHTIYLRDAFVTAPHTDASRVLDSSEKRYSDGIIASEIDGVVLYHESAKPVLIHVSNIPKEEDGTIRKQYAIARMLEESLPFWKNSARGEEWDDMRGYFLGTPGGSRSSLFINQETGAAMREVWNLINKHGLFGPIDI